VPFRALDSSVAAAAPATTAGAPLVSVGETLGSLRAELIIELGSRNDVDAPRVDKWINWAYKNLAGMLKLQELKGSLVVNLVVDQPFYLLPIQVRSIRQLSVRDSTRYYKGGVNLIESNEDEYRRQADNATYKPYLSPLNWFRYKRMLVFFPDPVAVLPVDVDFWVRPDDLVGDTDSPLLPPEFHEPLLLHARHRAWRSLRNYVEAKQAANDFLQALRPLIDTDAEEAAEAPHGLTVVRRASDLHAVRRR
jgi:hypothetical protein